MKVLFLANIPSPYRVDFYNLLGKKIDVTVVFEAQRAKNINFNWNDDLIKNFRAIFLSNNYIEEKKINLRILSYLNDDYDYIVATNYAFYTEMLAIIYMIKHKISYYLEIDGGIIRQENKLKYYFKKLLISKAKKCFSPSKNTDDFLIYYGASKKNIIRYPFSSLHDSDILKKPISIEEKSIYKKEFGAENQKVVLTIGQFIYRKGFDVLLNSLLSLKESPKVIIVGGKPTDEYRDLSSKYKGDVVFLPFQNKETIIKLYRSADIFVLPTREDIWGLVINEAMAQGLPVITTDKCVAGVALVNGNGRLIQANNSRLLSMAIDDILMDDKVRYEMGLQSLEIIKDYSIEAMVEKHIQIFSSQLK